MKKYLLSAFVILTFTFYALHQKNETENVGLIQPKASIQIPATLPSSPRQTSGSGFSDVATPANGSTPPPANQTADIYKNGSFTGNVADAFYGNVQVKAIISGGKITDVQFLQYPNDRGTSIEINTQAMPFLKQEAISAQSAQVDGVSGATQTSRAFIESLQSALEQAKI